MDNNLLNDRISRLKEWEQKESINEILFNTLSSLNAYMEERFEGLAGEIKNEAKQNIETPVIKTAVCKEEDIGKQIFLHPAASEPQIKKSGYITTVFAECDYFTIKELMQNNYSAEIKCKAGDYKTKVSLCYSLKYLNKLEALYYTFSQNGLPWQAVNGAYFYKFLDVYGIDDAVQEIDGFEIDFGKYAVYLSYDKTLLWNISTLTVPVAACEAKPAFDTLVYEHILKNLQFDENQYLVCHIGDRFTSFRRGQMMYVRTYIKQLEQMELLRITAGADNDSLLYLPVITNQKKSGFTDALAMKSYVPTRGEAERIIRSLNYEEDLRLVDIKVLPYTEENITRYKGIDYNFFVEKTTFLPDRRLLLFRFDIKINKLWAYEAMYFVLSELQLYFYEYKCVGEII